MEAILHVVLAGWFMTQLLKTWTGSRWAGILAGVTFAFSGYLTGYPALQLAILRSVIWLPLLLLCLHHAFSSGRWRWWIGAALVYATAFLAGHPQTFLHITYIVVPYCLLCLATLRIPHAPPSALHIPHSAFRIPHSALTFRIPHSALRHLPPMLTFFILTLLLSAAQLLPSLEFAQLSVRAHTDYAFVSGGFPLQDTWQLLFPGILTEFSPLYVGVVGIGLALFAIGYCAVSLWQKLADKKNLANHSFVSLQTRCCFFAIITLLALLLSYGDHSFLYPLFYRFAPGWQLFRGQERAAFLVTFGLSVLAGFGAAILPQLAYGWRRRAALWVLCLFSAGVFSFGLFWQIEQKSAVSNEKYLIIAALTTVAAAALLLILWLPGWGRRQQWLVLGLTVLTLFAANFSTDLTQFSPARKVILAPEMEALGKAVAEQSTFNLGLPGRVYNEFRIYEDYGIRQQIEDIWGSSPLRVARYAQLVAPEAQFPLDRMWRLLGVNHILTWRRELFVPSQLLSEFPQINDTTFLQRLNQADPRAWIVGRTEIINDEKALQQLADHNFDLENTGLLPPESTLSRMELLPGKSIIQLQRPASNRLHINVESENGGLLIISETWMAGWQVRNLQQIASEFACSAASSLAPDEAFSVQRVRSHLDRTAIATLCLGIRPYLLARQCALWVVDQWGHFAGFARHWRLALEENSPCNQLAKAPTLILCPEFITPQTAPTESWTQLRVRGSQWAGGLVVTRFFLVSLLWLAWFLRLYHLDFQELRGDESFGYFSACVPLPRSSNQLLHCKSHIRLPAILSNICGWVGQDTASLPCVFWGCAGVCWRLRLLFRLSRCLDFSLRSATLATLLLAISPYAIWHSQYAAH